MNYFEKYDVGKLDRIVRVILGLSVLTYTIFHPNILTGIMSLLLLYSGISGQCSAYRFLGVNTGCKLSEQAERTSEKSFLEGFSISLGIYLIMFIIYLVFQYFQMPS